MQSDFMYPTGHDYFVIQPHAETSATFHTAGRASRSLPASPEHFREWHPNSGLVRGTMSTEKNLFRATLDSEPAQEITESAAGSIFGEAAKRQLFSQDSPPFIPQSQKFLGPELEQTAMESEDVLSANPHPRPIDHLMSSRPFSPPEPGGSFLTSLHPPAVPSSHLLVSSREVQVPQRHPSDAFHEAQAGHLNLGKSQQTYLVSDETVHGSQNVGPTLPSNNSLNKLIQGLSGLQLNLGTAEGGHLPRSASSNDSGSNSAAGGAPQGFATIPGGPSTQSAPVESDLNTAAAEFIPGCRSRAGSVNTEASPQLQNTAFPFGPGAAAAAITSQMFEPLPPHMNTHPPREVVPSSHACRIQPSSSPSLVTRPRETSSVGGPQPSLLQEAPGVLNSATNQDLASQQGNSGNVPGKKMVQVVRGGCIFFVPESQALAEELTNPPSSLLGTQLRTSSPIEGTTPAASGLSSTLPHTANVKPPLINRVAGQQPPPLPPHQEVSRTQGPPSGQGRGDGMSWVGGRKLAAGVLSLPSRRGLDHVVLPDALWHHFNAQRIELGRQLMPGDARCNEVPSRYHSIYPLDSYSESELATPPVNGGVRRRRGATGSFGYPSALYKVVGATDGQWYAVRRFDNVRTTPKIAAAAAEAWRRVRHPNVVALHNVVLEHGALYFTFDYHPCAETLQQRYIDSPGNLIPERLLWSYIVQILTAVRAVHSANMACRMISLTHIILTSGGRLWLNSCGVADVLEFESRKSVSELQQDDLVSLGNAIVSLACRSPVSSQTLNDSIAFLNQNYSPDLHSLVVALVTKSETIHELCGRITSYLMDELDTAFTATNALESHLRQEYDNGRLLKLVLKLGTINERPQDQMNASWSETGDRYILKLFRDYVFHQVDHLGNPSMDMGHIIECLNKLDLGDSEKILLTSRDQRSILVVSFADVKRVLEETFIDLCHQSTNLQDAQSQGPVPTGAGFETMGLNGKTSPLLPGTQGGFGGTPNVGGLLPSLPQSASPSVNPTSLNVNVNAGGGPPLLPLSQPPSAHVPPPAVHDPHSHPQGGMFVPLQPFGSI